jgi:DNA-directed RNA polymerase subunit beta
VLPLPDLISIQRDSFDWLLKQGLKETLAEVSPIEDYQGSMKLYLREHWLEPPKNSVDECQAKGITYAQPLFINAEFINTQTGEIKQQQVFLGDFPVMTDRGTFIINGTERVVVSQLVRSPGAYYEQEIDKTSDRILYRGKIIPGRGAWLEFETDKKDMVGVRVDRKRKQPVTVLLTALGYTRPEIMDLFDEAESIRLTLEKDAIQTQDEAIIDIYKKLRPGEPQAVDSARNLFESLFFSAKRYDMARVGRYKVNRKLGELPDRARHALERISATMPPEKHDWVFSGDGKQLTYEDIVKAIYYLVKLHSNEPGYELDDIDHFGNRRLRSVGELIQNQLRTGFQRMERVVRERMTTQDVEAITPVSLINIRPVTASIREFFGTSQLSQFMDQVNSLSILTHKRRISALGPGGLSRERAGFEVRDVHSSHYGRMCPIETPEGPNIGLIGNLASYAQINEYGFVQTPYRKVEAGRVSEQIDYLTADEEDRFTIAQANAPLDNRGKFVNPKVLCRRKGGEIMEVKPTEVDYMDVAPHQIVSVATALIPFLEHDDANRALMGANMQKQAVPLVKPRAPYVGTGIEFRAAVDAGDVVVADKAGVVESVDAREIIVRSADSKRQAYPLRKFRRSNQDTCINQRVLVSEGDEVGDGDVLADGPSTEAGELALGQNLLVAFMPFEGHNFEDAIILSERLVKEDILTSIHIEEYEVDARETKLGPEEVTRDIPNVPEDALKDLDEEGIVRIGAEVVPGDVLVGKVTPKGETELTPEERLLRAIFGEKSREVRDTSLKVPHGEGGIVIGIRKFTRDAGDELPPGVNERVHVYVAQKRKISVGDKLAGRHGNKGVIAKILPVEDLPHLEDGTTVDIILNPHGVPGRMNLGQVLETHLGWVAHNGWVLDGMPDWSKEAGWTKDDADVAGPVHFATPVFDGAKDEEIFELLNASRANKDGIHLVGPNGKAALFDGRTGERYEEAITIGFTYILKLAHLVDDKIHARSTGPYSMITQQPLGGKAQFGGQRFGEMEVWALEAYGAAYALQELLTIKSDDVNGRVKVYEAIVKGDNIPEPGIPESFKVLIKEMQALCLNVDVLSATGEAVQVRDLSDEDGYRAAEELGIDLSRAERASADLEGR